MPKLSARTPVTDVANRWFYSIEETSTGVWTPGERINEQNMFSTASLSEAGVEKWQGMLYQAIASNILRSLIGADSQAETSENGVYKTDATTTNLPDTNKVGILEVYNETEKKYLRYSTYNVGRIEIWTRYFDGTTWGDWNYANGDSSLAFADGNVESGGIVRHGGTLSADVAISLATFNYWLNSTGGTFSIDIQNAATLKNMLLEMTGAIFSLIAQDSEYYNSFEFKTTGLELSTVPKVENQRILPSNDTENATGSTIYHTDGETLHMPSASNLVGTLFSYDHDNSGDIELVYQTFYNGVVEFYSRKKSGGVWYDWQNHLRNVKNGLTLLDGFAKLGGNLIENTVISKAGFDFTVEGDGGVVISTTSGSIQIKNDTGVQSRLTLSDGEFELALGALISIYSNSSKLEFTAQKSEFSGQAHGGNYIQTFSASTSFDANNGNNQEMIVTASTEISITNELPGTYIFTLEIDSGAAPVITINASFGTPVDNNPPLINADNDINVITLVVRPNGTKCHTINTITA